MTQAEWEEHLITHLPYCDGCPFCVAGRRPNAHHRRRGNQKDISSLVADYGFLKTFDEDIAPVLGVCVRPWMVYFATLVAAKGPEPMIAKRLARFMKDCGLRHFTYKSDREPAIRSL